MSETLLGVGMTRKESRRRDRSHQDDARHTAHSIRNSSRVGALTVTTVMLKQETHFFFIPE